MTDPVEKYYDTHAEVEWERLERHRTELAVTMRVLSDYLPEPPARILDVGGGVGRYAMELARCGYEVTLLDLSTEALNFARQVSNLAGVGLKSIQRGNALDLSTFEDHSFDAVLLMGPLYHLLQAEQRMQAVHEAVRVLVPGGLLFAAFINRFGTFRNAAFLGPANDWVSRDPAFALHLLQAGWQDAESSPGFTQAYFSHPDEIIPQMEPAGLSTLGLVNVEGVAGDNEAYINTLSGEAWETWVQFNYLIGMDPAARGLAAHLLYVGRKV